MRSRKTKKQAPPDIGRPGVTIFSDASFDPHSGVAGWAAWIMADGWSHGETYSGPLKSRMITPTHAELAAMANALVIAKKLGVLIDHVMLQSDCLEGLFLIRRTDKNRIIDNPAKNGVAIAAWNQIGRIHDECRGVAELIRDLVHAEGITLSLRHVRGHQEGGGRNWVNNRCDELAKQHMRKLREERKMGNGS